MYIIYNICIALTLPKHTSTECHWCFCGVPRVLQVKMQMAKSHNDVTKMIDVFSQVVVVILRYSHRQGVRISGTSCSLHMEGLSLSTISAILDHAICSYIIYYIPSLFGAKWVPFLSLFAWLFGTRQTASAKTSFGSTSMRWNCFLSWDTLGYGCFQKLWYPKMDGENNGKPY